MSQSPPIGSCGSNDNLWLDGHFVLLGNVFGLPHDFSVQFHHFIVNPVFNDRVFKNWGWTLQVLTELLLQDVPNDTGSVHPFQGWHPSHSTQNPVQLIFLCFVSLIYKGLIIGVSVLLVCFIIFRLLI